MKSSSRPSPATAIATLALAFAIGGGAWAATDQLVVPKRSVGTKQIKPEAVTRGKIADDAVTGAKVREHTLGEVPQATDATDAEHADVATRAGSADSADLVGYTRPFHVKLSFGEQADVAKIGPIKVIAQCTKVGGPARSRLIGKTTVSQTTMAGDDNFGGPGFGGTGFMPLNSTAASSARELLSHSDTDDGQTSVNNNIDDGWISSGGDPAYMISIDGETTLLGLNYQGADCVMAGMVSEFSSDNA